MCARGRDACVETRPHKNSRVRRRRLAPPRIYSTHRYDRGVARRCFPDRAGEEGSQLNINKALDKAHENLTFKEIVELPPSALQGFNRTRVLKDSLSRVPRVRFRGRLRATRRARAQVSPRAADVRRRAAIRGSTLGFGRVGETSGVWARVYDGGCSGKPIGHV